MIPDPPQGYVALSDGYEVQSFRRGPDARTLRVWAEGDWRPVTGLSGRINRRSVDVSFMVGPEPRDRRTRRVVPERIARPL